MRYATLHDRCRDRLARLAEDVGIPRPFVLDEFVARLAAHRGRRIRVENVPTGAEMPCGLWLETVTEDLVICDARATGAHRTHIVLHEISHMVCEHVGTPTARERGAAWTAAGAASPDRAALARSAYSDDDEQEAELLATMIALYASRPRPEPVADPDSADARVQDTFGPPGSEG